MKLDFVQKLESSLCLCILFKIFIQRFFKTNSNIKEKWRSKNYFRDVSNIRIFKTILLNLSKKKNKYISYVESQNIFLQLYPYSIFESIFIFSFSFLQSILQSLIIERLVGDVRVTSVSRIHEYSRLICKKLGATMVSKRVVS